MRPQAPALHRPNPQAVSPPRGCAANDRGGAFNAQGMDEPAAEQAMGVFAVRSVADRAGDTVGVFTCEHDV